MMTAEERCGAGATAVTGPLFFRNGISVIGLAIAVAAFGNIIFLYIVDLTSSSPSPYIALLTYIVLPVCLSIGLGLIVLGAWRERKRRLRQRPGDPQLPRLDLNEPSQRGSIALVATFGLAFTALSLAGAYRGYEFTESRQFCGELCHNVMRPESVTHDKYSHARVSCIECHVGAGADWYVRSKLSGLRQVYRTVSGTYPRPIETPVANLRPAPETCEQCHWPKKFWGSRLKVIDHFSSDKTNTPRQLRLLMKIGGGEPSDGVAGNIHWAMNIGNAVTYRSDSKRQTIPYVRSQEISSGRVTEYFLRGVDTAKTAALPERKMDCVDCHNRPTHVYMPPDRAVDEALASRRIDPSLPFAKAQAVEALSARYTTSAVAMGVISSRLQAFYRENFPDVAIARADAIQQMVRETQNIFNESMFPFMNVDWRTHPNNIGHLFSQGCFRCHDGDHVSKDGKVISKNCNICHTFVGGRDNSSFANSESVEFRHSVDIGDLRSAKCVECHGA